MTAPATCPVCQRTLDAVLQLYDEPAVDPRVAMCFYCAAFLEMTPAGVIELTDQAWLELSFELRDELTRTRRLIEVTAQRAHHSDGVRH